MKRCFSYASNFGLCPRFSTSSSASVRDRNVRSDGITRDTFELDAGEKIPDLEPYDLMMVMGGPQDTWQEDQYPWLVAEKAAIRKFVVEMQRPYFGICLGHQLLAAAIGVSRVPCSSSR